MKFKKTMTKTKRTCDDCGEKFEIATNETYKTLCRFCFIEFKKNELVILKNRIERLEAENKLLKANSGIGADLLKRLRHLCHPDKHNGSVLSHNVFAELSRL
jgi:ribosomal protein S14